VEINKTDPAAAIHILGLPHPLSQPLSIPCRWSHSPDKGFDKGRDKDKK